MPPIAELAVSPGWLLHEIDIGSDRIGFLPVSRHLLERANFLDGRAEIAVGEPAMLAVAEALAPHPPVPGAPDRFIFHVSFCGSTLLTRMLERPGRVFALREPHGLVGLADWKAGQGKDDPRLRPLADLARACLRARWQADEQVLVKPSNWANNLLPELCGEGMRPLFIDIGARAFLRAVFRGNRERIAFTLHAASHFAASRPEDAALLAGAVRAFADPLDRAAAITLVALHLQRAAFQAAMAANGWGPEHVLSYERIATAPLDAAQAANLALDLGLTAAELAEGVARSAGLDAKLAGRSFSAEGQEGVNDAIEHANGRHFDAAMAWAETAIPGWRAEAPPALSLSEAG